MGEMIIYFNIKWTKATITGADFDAAKAWVKANVTDKLPTDGSITATYNVQITT